MHGFMDVELMPWLHGGVKPPVLWTAQAQAQTAPAQPSGYPVTPPTLVFADAEDDEDDEDDEAPDVLACALSPDAPVLWADCETRVAWCLRNLTKGEKAYLYRLLHTGEGMRIDRCQDHEREERAALKKAREEKP
jgi:hypothetical protein